MSVDVATLVFEFKSDSAVTAEKRMDDLIAKGERLDAVAKRVRAGSEGMGQGFTDAAGAAKRAADGAMGLATAQGAVEQSTRGAARASAEVRAQRQLEAAAMRELSQATKAYERDQARTAAAVERLRMSVDPLAAAQARVNAEMAEASRLYGMGAISADEYARSTAVLQGRLADVDVIQRRAGGAARLHAHEMANLGSQFADIGVSLASGQALWMVAIQQGAQIGGIYGNAAARGATLAGTLGQLAGAAGGVATKFGPLLGVVGAATAAFGVFEREIDKNTNAATTWGDTLQATITVVGRHIMDGPIGEGLRWLDQAWTGTMDYIVKGALDGAMRTAAFFSASYKTIVANWDNLPGAFEAIFVSAANAALRALDWLVNGNIKLVNKVIGAWNNLGPIKAPLVPEVDFASMMLKPSQRAQKASADLSAALQKDYAAIKAAGQGLLREIARETDRVAAAKEKAEKATKDHTQAVKLERVELEQLKGVIENVVDEQKAWNVELLRTPDALNSLGDQFDDYWTLTSQFERAAEVAWELQGAIQQIGFSLKNGNWLSAAQGMIRAFESIRNAWQSGDKFGAGVGVVSAAGQMIGGKLGGALSGAAGGAALGMTLGGPVGAGIGAVVGGIAGLFGASEAKRQRQKAERDARAAEELRRAQETANARREMEIRLLELQGKSAEALARARQNELNFMDASLHALQKEVWALEDARRRRETLAAFEIQLLEAQGKATEALAIQRQLELDAMEQQYRALQTAVWAAQDAIAERDRVTAEWAEKVATAEQNLAAARNVLAEAYERESAALQATRDQFLGFANSIAAFRKSLYSGSTAGMNPFAAYRSNRSELDAAMAGIRNGETGAFERFQSVAQAFLSSSEGVAPNSQFVNRDRAWVARLAEEAEAAARAQATDAEKQIEELKAQVGLLIDLNGNVVSVKDAVGGVNNAVAALAAAEAAQASAIAQQNALVAAALAAAQAAYDAAKNAPPPANENSPGTWNAAGYMAKNPDVVAEAERLLAVSDRNSPWFAQHGLDGGVAGFARWHWENAGKYEGRGFATGGSFTVGGTGGTDSQFMPLMLTPGEMVNVKRDGGNGDQALLAAIVGELEALRRERAEDARQLKRDTKEAADILATVTQGGDAIRTEAA